MREGKMTEIISSWSLRRGKVWPTAKARLAAKPSITVWLEGLVRSPWGRGAMKSKTNQSSLGCRSAHACPCCPRTARFSVLPREQFGVLGKLPTFLWCSLVFSDRDSVFLIPHTQTKQKPPGALVSDPRALKLCHNRHLGCTITFTITVHFRNVLAFLKHNRHSECSDVKYRCNSFFIYRSEWHLFYTVNIQFLFGFGRLVGTRCHFRL